MGLFKRRSTDPEELQRIQAEIAAMSQRLEAADAEKRQLGERVQGIVTRLDTPIAPPPEPPPPPEPTVDPAEIDMLRARFERLSRRLDEVDQRITAISTELANQLSEISNDLESMGAKEPPTDQVVDELRDAQTRLANEQARYQIAFRHDLAELADRLRHS